MAKDSSVKAGIRDIQRRWVRRVVDSQPLSVSEFAVSAGMSDVTLTRFLNREDYEGALSPLNIEKIRRKANVPGPNDPWPEESPTGFSEGSTFRHPDKAERTAFSAMIEAALIGRPDASPWLLETDAMVSIHYLRGDVLITDAAVKPTAGDVVVAQSINERTEKVETIFRVIQPPYLVGVGNDPATRKPLAIDNDKVIVMGVVTEAIRATRRSMAE